ncbi:MAG: 50S ribosomal protein L10 [Gemmataceae bacterium]|nr:50S ribosomal protein L10 [Gemmataceae bacterium]
MSKAIKQLQMDSLKVTFKDVRDLVMLNIVGLNAIDDNKIRLGLRKKGIRLHQVKNSLCKRVFGELGLKADGVWEGNTIVAWGANSLKELSKELEPIVKKHEKLIKVKTAMADGQPVPFATALTMPTRLEAIGEVIGAILGPAQTIAAQLIGPAAQVASQLQSIADKKEEAAPAA